MGLCSSNIHIIAFSDAYTPCIWYWTCLYRIDTIPLNYMPHFPPQTTHEQHSSNCLTRISTGHNQHNSVKSLTSMSPLHLQTRLPFYAWYGACPNITGAIPPERSYAARSHYKQRMNSTAPSTYNRMSSRHNQHSSLMTPTSI